MTNYPNHFNRVTVKCPLEHSVGRLDHFGQQCLYSRQQAKKFPSARFASCTSKTEHVKVVNLRGVLNNIKYMGVRANI